MKRVRTKESNTVGVVLLEALAQRLKVRRKRIGSEARGEGRERGNLVATTPKPPVAQRAGGI